MAARSGLRDGADLFLPGLWFVYAVSRVVAMLGVLLSVALGAVSLTHPAVTVRVLLLAGFAVTGTVFLLWYSARIAEMVR